MDTTAGEFVFNGTGTGMDTPDRTIDDLKEYIVHATSISAFLSFLAWMILARRFPAIKDALVAQTKANADFIATSVAMWLVYVGGFVIFYLASTVFIALSMAEYRSAWIITLQQGHAVLIKEFEIISRWLQGSFLKFVVSLIPENELP